MGKQRVLVGLSLFMGIFFVFLIQFQPIDFSDMHPIFDPVKYVYKMTQGNAVGPLEMKRILLWTPFFGMQKWWFGDGGQSPFLHCPIKMCEIITNKSEVNTSDALLMHLRNLGDLPQWHPTKQIWILHNMEAPVHTIKGPALTKYSNSINWTSGYRRDCDLKTPYGLLIKRKKEIKLDINYAKNRSNKAIAFISNCVSSRMQYIAQLRKHYPVDIFGGCGKGDPCGKKEPCLRKLVQTYKFYLSFENSLCKDYITEKFWIALIRGSVPIVRGAEYEDYFRVAPLNSFIHVNNFTDTASLGKYLNGIKDTEYNGFYKWNEKYTAILDALTPYNCDLCAALHNKGIPNKAVKASDWWTGKECH